MRVLLVSRLGLSNALIRELRKMGLKEFVDYYKYRSSWSDEKDIIAIANAHKCDTIAVISNFNLAVRLLANGVKTVFVIIPRLHTPTEIVSADICMLEGEIKMSMTRV